MKFYPLIIFFSFMLTVRELPAQKRMFKPIEWILAARLQNADGTISTGFAGTINGIYNNALFVAGGSNFPGKLPWEGGKKHYSGEVHILRKHGNGYQWDRSANTGLPEPIAYCGSTSTAYGIVYAGGENEAGLSKKAFILAQNHDGGLTFKRLPDLPFAITNIALTHIGSMVYAVGGDGVNTSYNTFYCIDIANKDAKWQTLPHLPLALANTIAVAQKNRFGNCIYVIGGRTKKPSGISDLHGTTFRYNVSTRMWAPCAPVSDGEQPMNLSAAAGVPVGNHGILVLGGDNGLVFHRIETLLAQIAVAKTTAAKDKLIIKKNKLNTSHTGFYNGVLLYDTDKDAWTTIGRLPFPAHVTTTAVRWGENVVLSNGEIKPGIRTPDIMLEKIVLTQQDAE